MKCAIYGIICEYGKKYNVPTPVNDRIVEIVKKEQNKELPLKHANLKMFEDLV